MTDTERDALRAIQDRWLSIPSVQARIREHGEDAPIASSSSPTFRDVRTTVLLTWRAWFEIFTKYPATYDYEAEGTHQ